MTEAATTLETTPTAGALSRPRHTNLAILALAIGGFAIGTTEFVTMGLLPEIARGVDISIPTAGHVVSAYALVGLIALACVAATWAWIPHQPADHGASMGAELRSLKRLQVWLALLIGTVGFGGMFATYSFIAPTMTTLAGFSAAAVPVILAVYGVGMTTGAFLSGRVAQRGILRGIVLSLAAIAVILGLFGFAAHSPWTAVPAVFLLGLVPTILVPMLQTRLMDVAHEGQSLAAALNHSTLNMANALGAWLGSVVLAAGYGYEWPSRVGVLLAVAGLGIALVSGLLERRQRSVLA